VTFVEIIARKRDGRALTREAIDFAVAAITTGTAPDYQISALLMAIVLRGMTAPETAWLTDAMVRSGDRVDLSDIPGVKIGKHSTGGVGDKVSIALAPLAAACGAIVPKMSGRGLGHTGGTLDKLESIPGFRVDLSIEEFKRVVREVGTCIIGQTARLAPADRKLYALRDVTGTIDSIPLISASIMSKKLAEGSSALLLDVKCGDGAFMRDRDAAQMLAEAMVAIGAHTGVRTEALITGMDAPLGNTVGNALEIREAIETLRGHGPADVMTLVTRIVSRMLVIGDIEPDQQAALARVQDALGSGRALETFARMIDRQGGNARVVEDDSLLPQAPARTEYAAPRAGFVTRLGAHAIGQASNVLGAGRARVGDRIDHAVGVVLQVAVGDQVQERQPVLELHHRDGRGLDEALALCRDAVRIEDAPPSPGPRVLGEVR
jgi:pyrimidine-nucleoside phosphorylase/thymidine phosphorylase